MARPKWPYAQTMQPPAIFKKMLRDTPTGRLAAGMGSSGGTGQVSEPQFLQNVVMNFVAPQSGGQAGLQGDWGPPGFTTVRTDNMVKGANWEVYKNAVLARGANPSEIEELVAGGYNCIAFWGMASVHFFSMFDKAFLGHMPSIEYVNAIKANSRIGTKVGIYFASYEDVSQRIAYNQLWTPLEDICTTYLRDCGAAQSGVNALPGCTYHNFFQVSSGFPQAPCGTQNATTFTNCWVCDVENLDYPGDWAAAARDMIISRFGTTGLDFIMVDNVFSDPFWEPTSNVDATYTSAIYRDGQRLMWSTVKNVFEAAGMTTKLAGNCTLLTTNYTPTQIPRRYVEYVLHAAENPNSAVSENLATIKSKITDAKDLELIMLGQAILETAATYNNRSYNANTQAAAWSGTSGGLSGTGWREIYLHAQSLGILNKVHAISRSGNTALRAFPLHWHPGGYFRPIA